MTMIEWNKVTWYSQITAVILGIAIFYVGFYIGSAHKIAPTAIDEPFETARLGFEGQEVRILTNEVGTTRNFVFQDIKTSEVISTLTVVNINIEAPSYKIVKGSARDWLVVTRIEGSGTGYIKRVDDWYILANGVKQVLSYISQMTLAPLLANEKNEYFSTETPEISLDDSMVGIKVTERVCSSGKDSNDKDCSESSHTDYYEWSGDGVLFTQKR